MGLPLQVIQVPEAAPAAPVASRHEGAGHSRAFDVPDVIVTVSDEPLRRQRGRLPNIQYEC
jgi:hypothetical protein